MMAADGRCFAADALMILHDQGVVDFPEHQTIAKDREPATNGRPWRKIRWQEPP